MSESNKILIIVIIAIILAQVGFFYRGHNKVMAQGTKETKCLLKCGNALSDLDFRIYCIDGVQYIKSGQGITPYRDIQKAGSPTPLLRRCTCNKGVK